jgi:DNA-binding CsgD family transcriptional regulator
VNSWEARSCAKSLREISEAPGFLSQVLRLIDSIAQVRDETELVAILKRVANHIGATSAYFMTFLREDRAFASYRLFLACDPLWGLEYQRGRCYEADPWLTYAMRHSSPALASDIATADESAHMPIALAQRYGFQSAIVVPAPAGSELSRLGLLVLGADSAGFFEADGYAHLRVVLLAIATELHDRCASFARRDIIADRNITTAEIDLLGHELDGRDSKTIARLLGISAGAVDARFRRLNAKLHCQNRRRSAILAVEYGLVPPRMTVQESTRAARASGAMQKRGRRP